MAERHPRRPAKRRFHDGRERREWRMPQAPRPLVNIPRKGRGDDGAGGVREPRNPRPPSDEDGAAADPES